MTVSFWVGGDHGHHIYYGQVEVQWKTNLNKSLCAIHTQVYIKIKLYNVIYNMYVCII